MFSKIVFVGPQGSGKTTQAVLLRSWLKLYGIKVNIVSFTYYTIFHRSFLRIAVSIAKLFRRTVHVRFYLDEPPGLSLTPELFKIFFPLFIYLHIIGLVVDSSLFRFKRGPFIEHDGFVFKQVVDLYYLAKLFDLSKSKLFKFFLKLALGIISSLDYVAIVFFVDDYDKLRERYNRQRLAERWRRIEPPDYIILQQTIYKVLSKGCIVDSSGNIKEVFMRVKECLKLQS